MWQALIPVLGTIFDKIIPDPAAAADAKLKAMELAQRGELAVLDADVRHGPRSDGHQPGGGQDRPVSRGLEAGNQVGLCRRARVPVHRAAAAPVGRDRGGVTYPAAGDRQRDPHGAAHRDAGARGSEDV